MKPNPNFASNAFDFLKTGANLWNIDEHTAKLLYKVADGTISAQELPILQAWCTNNPHQ